MILNQWTSPTCGNFWLVAILQHMGISYDWESILYVKVPFIGQLEKLFKDRGLIQQLVSIPTPKLVDIWLNKWEWLLVRTSRWDFTINDNDGNIIEFDGISQHYFVLTKDCWDKWEIQNSWWPDWNWTGTCYMNKSDFKYLSTPKRVIKAK